MIPKSCFPVFMFQTNNWVVHIALKYFHETFVSDKQSCLPHIVTSNLEHDSVKVVLQQLEKQGLAGQRSIVWHSFILMK